jgi:hypothetical protein
LVGGEFFPVQPPYIPGVGVAGHVRSVGGGVDEGWLGRRVLADLDGGGYAERVVADVERLIPIPDALGSHQAMFRPRGGGRWPRPARGRCRARTGPTRRRSCRGAATGVVTRDWGGGEVQLGRVSAAGAPESFPPVRFVPAEEVLLVRVRGHEVLRGRVRGAGGVQVGADDGGVDGDRPVGGDGKAGSRRWIPG